MLYYNNKQFKKEYIKMIKHKELILFYFKQNELNFFKYYYTYIKYFIIKRLINKIQLKILLLK